MHFAQWLLIVIKKALNTLIIHVWIYSNKILVHVVQMKNPQSNELICLMRIIVLEIFILIVVVYFKERVQEGRLETNTAHDATLLETQNSSRRSTNMVHGTRASSTPIEPDAGEATNIRSNTNMVPEANKSKISKDSDPETGMPLARHKKTVWGKSSMLDQIDLLLFIFDH